MQLDSRGQGGHRPVRSPVAYPPDWSKEMIFSSESLVDASTNSLFRKSMFLTSEIARKSISEICRPATRHFDICAVLGRHFSVSVARVSIRSLGRRPGDDKTQKDPLGMNPPIPKNRGKVGQPPSRSLGRRGDLVMTILKVRRGKAGPSTAAARPPALRMTNQKNSASVECLPTRSGWGLVVGSPGVESQLGAWSYPAWARRGRASAGAAGSIRAWR